MKLLLIVAIMSVIMLIAVAVSEQYKDRADFYRHLKLFLTQFKINISFKQDKVTDFLSTIKCKKQFKVFVDDYINYLSTGELSLDNIKILDDLDKADLTDMIISLGRHDVTSELGQVESYIARVDVWLAKAQEDKVKLCPMIIKLSLLFSIGLAILLL